MKPCYTHKQMIEIMQVTRSWTLNNPSGPIPYLPIIWSDNVSIEENEKAIRETMPPLKKPHWIIKLLFKI